MSIYLFIYLSIKVITTTVTTTVEEKYRVLAPESMQETFLSDSEDEGGKCGQTARLLQCYAAANWPKKPQNINREKNISSQIIVIRFGSLMTAD